MKRILQYHWWQYVLAVLLPILLWCTVFDALGKPEKNECLRILFVGQTLDEQRLQEDLKDAIGQMTDQKLKQVKVTQTMPNGLAMGELLTARQFDCDLVILASNDLPEGIGQGFFAPLSQELLAHFPEHAAYTEPVENTALPYGIALSGETRFAGYLSEQADCVLFFSTESVNLAALNGKGSAKDDAALRAAEYLLEEPG